LTLHCIADPENETWEQTEKNVRRAVTTSLELSETQVRVTTTKWGHRAGGTGLSLLPETSLRAGTGTKMSSNGHLNAITLEPRRAHDLKNGSLAGEE